MYYIYILYSSSADKFYIGYTDNPERRLNEHNTSEHSTFTSKFRPWIMKAIYECSESRQIAINIERLIKRQKSRSLIEKMVRGEKLSGELAQLVRVPHLRD